MSTTSLTLINGVSLLTRTGEQKSRYSPEERLQILGATDEDLDAFVELFCPDGPCYAITKAGSGDPRDWTTPKGRLTRDLILHHLVGNLTPNIPPKWVAPRSWEVTHWVGLDVDFRGDRLDFQQRCGRALQALRELGVSRSALLESETPSGGRHYRFFLNRKVQVAAIPDVFALVGIKEVPGQIEIFPKMKKGMRLPFGFIPGKVHDPSRFVNFIRAFRRGEIWRVDWYDCVRRAGDVQAAAYRRAQESAPTEASLKSKPVQDKAGQRALSKPFIMGVPKHLKKLGFTHSPQHVTRYMSLLSQPISSQEEANELWTLGILEKGTRTEVTKRLAWHLLVVRRHSVEDATAILTEWVYRTGKTTSHDVEEDNARGTRKVAEETARIVQWTAAHRQPATIQDRNLVSKEEVESVVQQLGDRATDRSLVLVALNFLRFVKLKGTESSEGWTAMVAVLGVIRRWPGCDGMKYKPLIEALRDSGIIRMTREKKQSPDGKGRPRTYLMTVPPRLRAGASMSVEEALQYALERARATRFDGSTTGRDVVESNRYRGIISPLPGETEKSRNMEAAQAKSRQDDMLRPHTVSGKEDSEARSDHSWFVALARLEAKDRYNFKVYHLPDGPVVVRKQRNHDVPAVRYSEELEKPKAPDPPFEDRSLGQNHGPPDQFPRYQGDGS
jgi:hypothetical protein